MLATYEIVCSKGYDADIAAGGQVVPDRGGQRGQEGLTGSGYVPLPDAFKQQAADCGQRNLSDSAGEVGRLR